MGIRARGLLSHLSWECAPMSVQTELTFLRPAKVPMRVSQRPSRPDTPLYCDLPLEKALLRRRTYEITSSCTSALARL